MARIELRQANLVYEIRHQGRSTLKEFLLRRLDRKVESITRIPALQDIDLEVGDGERVGVIGHNGSGKSTLLRLLAGIYPVASGSRVVEGRISSLFDVTLGIDLDASGFDNILFRGYLQGETPKSIRAKVPEIAEFTELGPFLDLPVRYYSSGMLVQLGFAIATAVRPEILLVDEVLSAGDLAFQDRAQERMRNTMAQAKLIVMVSHDLDMVARFCDRVVWMDHGRVKQHGPAAAVVAAYQAHAGYPAVQADHTAA